MPTVPDRHCYLPSDAQRKADFAGGCSPNAAAPSDPFAREVMTWLDEDRDVQTQVQSILASALQARFDYCSSFSVSRNDHAAEQVVGCYDNDEPHMSPVEASDTWRLPSVTLNPLRCNGASPFDTPPVVKPTARTFAPPPLDEEPARRFVPCCPPHRGVLRFSLPLLANYSVLLTDLFFHDPIAEFFHRTVTTGVQLYLSTAFDSWIRRSSSGGSRIASATSVVLGSAGDDNAVRWDSASCATAVSATLHEVETRHGSSTDSFDFLPLHLGAFAMQNMQDTRGVIRSLRLWAVPKYLPSLFSHNNIPIPAGDASGENSLISVEGTVSRIAVSATRSRSGSCCYGTAAGTEDASGPTTMNYTAPLGGELGDGDASVHPFVLISQATLKTCNAFYHGTTATTPGPSLLETCNASPVAVSLQFLHSTGATADTSRFARVGSRVSFIAVIKRRTGNLLASSVHAKGLHALGVLLLLSNPAGAWFPHPILEVVSVEGGASLPYSAIPSSAWNAERGHTAEAQHNTPTMHTPVSPSLSGATAAAQQAVELWRGLSGALRDCPQLSQGWCAGSLPFATQILSTLIVAVVGARLPRGGVHVAVDFPDALTAKFWTALLLALSADTHGDAGRMIALLPEGVGAGTVLPSYAGVSVGDRSDSSRSSSTWQTATTAEGAPCHVIQGGMLNALVGHTLLIPELRHMSSEVLNELSRFQAGPTLAVKRPLPFPPLDTVINHSTIAFSTNVATVPSRSDHACRLAALSSNVVRYVKACDVFLTYTPPEQTTPMASLQQSVEATLAECAGAHDPRQQRRREEASGWTRLVHVLRHDIVAVLKPIPLDDAASALLENYYQVMRRTNPSDTQATLILLLLRMATAHAVLRVAWCTRPVLLEAALDRGAEVCVVDAVFAIGVIDAAVAIRRQAPLLRLSQSLFDGVVGTAGTPPDENSNFFENTKDLPSAVDWLQQACTEVEQWVQTSVAH